MCSWSKTLSNNALHSCLMRSKITGPQRDRCKPDCLRWIWCTHHRLKIILSPLVFPFHHSIVQTGCWRYPRKPNVHSLWQSAHCVHVWEGRPSSTRIRTLHRSVWYQTCHHTHPSPQPWVASQFLWKLECRRLAGMLEGLCRNNWNRMR